MFVLFAIFQYDFVHDVYAFSVEHNLQALDDMCSTNHRHMWRRRQRQGDDVVEDDEENWKFVNWFLILVNFNYKCIRPCWLIN